MTHDVRLPELEAEARKLGRVIKAQMKPGVGFVLVLYNFGMGGSLTYLSSGERQDTINMLKELLVTLQLHQDQPPGRPAAPDPLG